MVRIRATSLVLAALVAGLLLAACGGGGSDELLPGTTADQINSNLDQVRVSYEEGDCEKAEDGVAEVSTEVDELGKVDAKLKKALRQGAAKLSEVVRTCGAAEQEAEEKSAEEAAEEEQAQFEAEEEQAAEEAEQFEQEQKSEEQEAKAEERAQKKAEKQAEQPGPSEEGEESNGHEKQEESEPPVEGAEEVTPPGGGPAGGIGPGAEAGGEG